MKYSQTGANTEERTDVFAMPPVANQPQVDDAGSESDEQLPLNLPALDSDAAAHIFSRDAAIQHITGVASYFEARYHELLPLASQAQESKTVTESLKSVNSLLEVRIAKDEAEFATMREVIVAKNAEITLLDNNMAELDALRASNKQQKAELDNLKAKSKHANETIASFSKKLRIITGERDKALDEMTTLKDYHTKESVPRLELDRVQVLLSEATLRLNAHHNENDQKRAQAAMTTRLNVLAQISMASSSAHGEESSHENANEPPHNHDNEPSSNNKSFNETPRADARSSFNRDFKLLSHEDIKQPTPQAAKQPSNKEVQALARWETNESSDNDVQLIPHEDVQLLPHENIEQPPPQAVKVSSTEDAKVSSIYNEEEEAIRLDREQLEFYRRENQELRAERHTNFRRLNWLTYEHKHALAALEAAELRETKLLDSANRDAAWYGVLRARAAREQVKEGEG